MIEKLIELIPSQLSEESGAAFHSGRVAFSKARDLYLLGFNPGGTSDEQSKDTVTANAEKVMQKVPHRWSAYVDENWSTSRRPHLLTGKAPMQVRVQHLLYRIGLDPKETPSSDLIFVRSQEAKYIQNVDRKRLVELCWPFHQAVISRLGVRVVLCMGRQTTPFIQEKTGAYRQVDSFVENNRRGWLGACYLAPNGLKVVQVPHPSQADWTKPPTDPSDFVKRALAG